MSLQDLTQSSKKSYSPIEIEEMFFGAIIGGKIDSENILKIKREYCASQDCSSLYDIIIKLHESSGYIDYLSILTELSKHKSSTDSKTFLERIINRVPEEFSTSKALALLEENFIRRKSVEIYELAKQKIQQNPYMAPDITNLVSEKIEQLVNVKVDYDIGKEIDLLVENILSDSFEREYISTGIQAMDKVFGGFPRKEVTIVAGRPGHTKTTSCASLVRSTTKKNNGLVASVFQLEMGKQSFGNKLLANVGNISLVNMRTKSLTDEEKQRLPIAAQELKSFDKKLYIFDNVYNVTEMNRINRSIKADISFVDFITLMDEAQEEDIRRALGRLMWSFKRFSKINNMAYVIFSQLGRGPDAREGHRPMQGDLAESDLLTQYASEILLLFYKYKYTNDESHKNNLYIIFDKTRYTGIGDVKLYLNADRAQISDL